jgi:type I restriction enzyme S subunit
LKGLGLKFVSEAHFSSLGEQKKTRRGDVFVNSTGTGTLGRIAYWDSDTEIAYDGHVTLVRLSPEHEPKFFYYLLQTPAVQTQILNNCISGSTNQVELSREPFRRIQLRHPATRQEQAAIAEILTTVDQAIAQTEALIAKQRRIKAGLLHDLLTRGIDEAGRLRDPATHRFKQTAVGLAPVEWEVKTIGEMASFVGSGVTPTGGSNVYGHEGIIFIRSQNVYNDGLVLDDVAYIDAPTNQRMQRSQVSSHDVLLNITGASIGRCCFVPGEFPAANVNQHVCIIRLPDATHTDALYLSAFLASPFGQRQVKLLNAGGNREGLNYQQVKSIVVAYPVEQDERDRFAELMSAINESIQVENERREKLLRLKSGLMQDLLTGGWWWLVSKKWIIGEVLL